MRRFLLVAFAMLVVAGGAFLGFVKCVVVPEWQRADASSRAYAERIAETVLQNWDAVAMRSEASSEFLDHVSPTQLNGLFASFSNRLGSIVTIGEPKGEANIFIAYPDGKMIKASYVVPAQFERSAGSIRISMLQKDGRWQVAGLFVNSDALFDIPGGNVPSSLPADVRTAARND